MTNVNLNFIIVGAQKSASTFVHHCLDEHPNVFIPKGEIPFFESPDYEEAGKDLSSIDHYFSGETRDMVLGIKRPNYLTIAEVPDRIKEHIPNCKVIAVLRNPIDRAVSAYYHNINFGFLPALDVNVGIKLILDGDKEFLSKYPRAVEVLEFGLYGAALERYFDRFGQKSALVLFQDDIVSRPSEVLKRLYSFVGVSDDFVPEARKTRPMAVVYNVTRLKFLRLQNRFLYKYNENLTRLSVRPKGPLAYLTFALVRGIDRFILKPVYGNEKTELSAEVRERLAAYYQGDLLIGSRLLDVDLGKKWNLLD